MELKLDKRRVYALALEGGGAKGAYHVGCWKALQEAGVQFSAVSGTSVGALNGGLMAMDQLERAEQLWLNIRFSQVMDVDDGVMRGLFRRDLSSQGMKSLAEALRAVMKNKGFDVTPLCNLLGEEIDEEAIRNSQRELFIITYSISDRRELELRARDLKNPGEIRDMMLASAYLPAFRNEKLGGKRYTDGGVADAIPLHVLVEKGYRDIIVVRLNGVGWQRSVKIPPGTHVYTVAPERDLGSVLNFDVEQSRFDMSCGYYDAQRLLYGLSGKLFYLERHWDEERAYRFLLEQTRLIMQTQGEAPSLHQLNQVLIPRVERRLDAIGDYYDVLVTMLEAAAEEAGLDPFQIFTEESLIAALAKRYSHKFKRYPSFISKTLLQGDSIISKMGKLIR